MQETKNNTVTDEPQRIRKTIGKTTYEVSLHFSKTSTEKPHDKLKRIIINDCTNPQ